MYLSPFAAPRRPVRAVRRTVAAALVGLVVVVATACIPPEQLQVTTVVQGLSQPWDIAFTPDGTMLYTEKPGRIDAFIGGTTRVLATVADVRNLGEGGLLGLAVDSQFASNRYIYTCMVSTIGGAADVRVARWTVNAGYTALTNRLDIITGIQAAANGRHSGCRPRFGPDGYLWVGTGDAAVGTNPQNPRSLNGKVLRVDRNGAGAPGNPGGNFLPQIYTYGHRNVQGIAFRPSDGAAFSVEHGTSCDDEVNRLVAGGNYGWDPIPGYDETRPMTDLVKFPAAKPAVWSSGCPTIAPSGGTFVNGPIGWNGWNNQLALAVLKGTELRVLGTFDGNDAPEMQWVRIEDQGRLRSVVQGPDGSLYIAQDANPGKILKVTAIDVP